MSITTGKRHATCRQILLSLALLCSLNPVKAQNQLNLGELQPGQMALNMSLTEQQQVEQDTLNATLSFTAQGRNRIELQEEVNTSIAEALDILAETSGLDTNTGRYQVYIVPVERPTRTDISNPVWRAQQSIQLSSQDSEAMLPVIGQLQETGFTMDNLYYSLSPALYEEITAGLMQTALGKLQGRAEAAASALGKSRAELIEVSMDGSPNFRPPYMPMAVRTMAASADFAPPQADPGETQVTVTISARAVLSP